MLYICGYINDVSRFKLTRFFVPFLIPTISCCYEQNLTAAVLCVVNVPVVAAGRLKGYVSDNHLLEREHIKIALSVEIFGEVNVFTADRENTVVK